MTNTTKQVLLRLPTEQVKQLEKIANERRLKNVQTLLYRWIENELIKYDNESK
ncbi:hypothetical protein [Vibrio rotiferianus]|uniref:hypothetical protein n=1 Tax=Vibrio rotiferianus TaxID=190895 RepID=UPI001360B5F6|nr:hypothetical protein [Vibrio rotiferianus]